MDAVAQVVTAVLPGAPGLGPPAGGTQAGARDLSRFAGMVFRATEARQGQQSADFVKTEDSGVGALPSLGGDELAALSQTVVVPGVLGAEAGAVAAGEQTSAGQDSARVAHMVAALRQRVLTGAERHGADPEVSGTTVTKRDSLQEGRIASRDDSPVRMEDAMGVGESTDAPLGKGDFQEDASSTASSQHSGVVVGMPASVVTQPVPVLTVPVLSEQAGGKDQLPEDGYVMGAPLKPLVGSGPVTSPELWVSTTRTDMPELNARAESGVFADWASMGNREVDSGKFSPDRTPAVADETVPGDHHAATVMRRLPSGVTVVNPEQTMNGHGMLQNDSGVPAVDQEAVLGRLGREHRLDEEPVQRSSESVANTLSGGTELRLGGANASGSAHAGDQQGSSPGSPADFAVGGVSGDKVTASDTPRVESDKNRFQDSILNQVRDRLATYEPTSANSKITLKLNPGELGELHIQVQMHDQRMNVEIMAQNPAVREVLLQNSDQLKESLARQNIAMERFDVSAETGQSGDFSQFFREGRQAEGQRYEGPLYAPVGYMTDEQSPGSVVYSDGHTASLVDMRF